MIKFVGFWVSFTFTAKPSVAFLQQYHTVIHCCPTPRWVASLSTELAPQPVDITAILQLPPSPIPSSIPSCRLP